MGLFSALLTSPLAPARAVVWVAQRVADQAEAEYYDPAPVWRQLNELNRRLEHGEIDEETFENQEDVLLARLSEITEFRQRQAE